MNRWLALLVFAWLVACSPRDDGVVHVLPGERCIFLEGRKAFTENGIYCAPEEPRVDCLGGIRTPTRGTGAAVMRVPDGWQASTGTTTTGSAHLEGKRGDGWWAFKLLQLNEPAQRFRLYVGTEEFFFLYDETDTRWQTCAKGSGCIATDIVAAIDGWHALYVYRDGGVDQGDVIFRFDGAEIQRVDWNAPWNAHMSPELTIVSTVGTMSKSAVVML